jgi:gamma-glutamyltranspeptidase / glutathione hydrolase
MLVRSSEGAYETIDFREKAPLLSNETMYVQNINLSLVGGLAVGVPGELAGNFRQLWYIDL